jgi:Domain of unknown function (DUF4397)/LysM domain
MRPISRTTQNAAWIGRRVGAAGGLAVALTTLAHADARAAASARFVHAVPGAGPAELAVVRRDRELGLGRAGFGKVGEYERTPSGSVRLELRLPGGEEVARTSARLRDGRRYTVVALTSNGGIELRIYPVRGARARVARLRTIHAAAELGSPDLRLDGRTVAERLAFKDATPYLTVRPGEYELSAVRPDDGTLVSRKGIRLTSGRSFTTVLIGTRGERARILLVRDAGAPERGARQPAGRAGARTYVVRRGDSLWRIAERRLGARASNARVLRLTRRLWALNARRIGTGDPDLIFAGTVLRLP